MKKKAAIIAVILVIAVSLVYFLSPGTVVKSAMVLERGSLEQKSVKVDDHQVVYLESGKGNKEAILMIHGFSADKDNYTRFSKAFRSNYHLVIPDLPGYGESTRLAAENYDILSQVKRLKRFVETIKLSKFHIIGNSMGGHIAGVYAATYPTDVLSLGLIDNAGIPSAEPSEYQKKFKATGKNQLLAHSVDDYDRVLKFVFVKPPFIPGPVKKYFAERAVKNQAFYQKIYTEALNARPYPLEPLLEDIKAKTLIIWGDKDRILDVSAVKVMQNKLPWHKTVIMKDCGHSPMIERPSETAEHYKRFLDTI